MMQKMRKLIVVLLVMSLLWTSVGITGASAAESKGQNDDWTYDSDNYSSTNTYYYYMQKHQNAAYPEREIAVDVTNFRLEEPTFGNVANAPAMEASP